MIRSGSRVLPAGKNNAAQTLLEYVMLVGIIVLVMTAMAPYLRRSLQSLIKTTADQLANQQEADQFNAGRLVETAGGQLGFLVNSMAASRLTSQRDTSEVLGTVGGSFSENISINDASTTYLGSGGQ